jgi:hypothetical protein
MQVSLSDEPQRSLSETEDDQGVVLEYDSEWLGILKANNNKIPRTSNKNMNIEVTQDRPIILDDMTVIPFTPEPKAQRRQFCNMLDMKDVLLVDEEKGMVTGAESGGFMLQCNADGGDLLFCEDVVGSL